MRKLTVILSLLLAVAAFAFRVDNNEPPSATLGAVDSEVSGDISISYTLTDREGDILTILCEYSVDGGETWAPATVKNPTADLGPDRYAGEVVWDSVADLDGHDEADVRFRVTPSDNDTGEAGLSG